MEELGRRTGVQRDFRYLTLDNHLHSFFFPPFQAVDADVNALTIAQLFIVAFSMDYGLVYGGNYYSQMNLAALHRVARKVTSEIGNATLEDVARYLDDPASRLKDAEQVRMTFEFLQQYDQLANGPSDAEEILIDRAIERGEVIYFYTPTLAEPTTARMVAGLGLFSVIAVAMRRKKLGKSCPPIRILVDEFQEIVGSPFPLLQRRAESFASRWCLPTRVLPSCRTATVVWLMKSSRERTLSSTSPRSVAMLRCFRACPKKHDGFVVREAATPCRLRKYGYLRLIATRSLMCRLRSGVLLS